MYQQSAQSNQWVIDMDAALGDSLTLSEMGRRGLRFGKASRIGTVPFETCRGQDGDFAESPAKVIRNMRIWPDAEASISHEWLRRRYGDVELQVAVGHRLNRVYEKMPLRQALDVMRTPATPQAQSLYLRQVPVPGPLPEIEKMLRVPEICPKDRAVLAHLWVGPEGSVQPFHKDNHHPLAPIEGLLVQVEGEKEVLLVSAEYDHLMAQRSGSTADYHFSRLDLFGEACEANRNIEQIEVAYATIGSEEAVLIPSNTWHHVRSMSLSVSVSFWWHKQYVSDVVFRLLNSELERPYRPYGATEYEPITPAQVKAYGGLPAVRSTVAGMSASARKRLIALLPKEISKDLA
ncbi:cupin-like domain-containing protein [Lysobacter sp. CA196]|uniref:cupin-like domain-containing protein n=1 Tax=Lysobacter sp. CA196 TaxID=3455606 RepID=UPI003F8D03FC